MVQLNQVHIFIDEIAAAEVLDEMGTLRIRRFSVRVVGSPAGQSFSHTWTGQAELSAFISGCETVAKLAGMMSSDVRISPDIWKSLYGVPS